MNYCHFLILLFVVLVACSNQPRVMFIGKINNQFDSKIEIFQDKDKLSGHFYYANDSKSKIKLIGQLIGDTLILKEFNNAENKLTGIFYGRFDGTSYEGYWEDPENAKKVPFLFYAVNLSDKNNIEKTTNNALQESLKEIRNNQTFKMLNKDQLLLQYYGPKAQDDTLSETVLDTIFYFGNNKKRALVIFYTYELYDECHACGPSADFVLFEQEISEDQLWIEVRKAKGILEGGYWGQPGALELVQIGRNNYAVSRTIGGLWSGIMYSGISYYDLNQFKEIFFFISYEDNSAARVEENEKSYEFESKATFIKENKEYYDIQVECTGTMLKNPESKKIISCNGVKRYVFDAEKQMYVEKKK